MNDELVFPSGFLWGAATAAHQVEGNNQLSDWWSWETLPGRILDGTSSVNACEHWSRFRDDFDLLRGLGHTAHRFSVEWSRIEPEPGRFDDAALEHYSDVTTALLERGIEPVVTLHHFTNPHWLARQGAWLNPQTPHLFERYVRRVVEVLRGRVRFWVTVNEPNVYALMAFLKGEWPPGRRSFRDGYRVIRQLLLGHARAHRAIHELDPRPQVAAGFAHSMQWYEPSTPRSPADRLAAWIHSQTSNWRMLDAFISGRLRFPLGFGELVPDLVGTLDFVGLNYYSRYRVRFDRGLPYQGFSHLGPTPGAPVSLFGWEIYPRGLFNVLRGLRRYPWPVLITENGVADESDELRPAYLVSHLAQLHRAIEESQRVLAYLHWTSTDNFEWAQGLRMRFGLIHVDFRTQVRTIKPSGHLYGEIARSNSILPRHLREFGRWQVLRS